MKWIIQLTDKYLWSIALLCLFVITASNACVCDPLDCYWDPDYNYQVISHSNGCTAPDHSCNPGRPE